MSSVSCQLDVAKTKEVLLGDRVTDAILADYIAKVSILLFRWANDNFDVKR